MPTFARSSLMKFAIATRSALLLLVFSVKLTWLPRVSSRNAVAVARPCTRGRRAASSLRPGCSRSLTRSGECHSLFAAGRLRPVLLAVAEEDARDHRIAIDRHRDRAAEDRIVEPRVLHRIDERLADPFAGRRLLPGSGGCTLFRLNQKRCVAATGRGRAA